MANRKKQRENADFDEFYLRTLNERDDWLMWEVANREAVRFGIYLPEPKQSSAKRSKIGSQLCA